MGESDCFEELLASCEGCLSRKCFGAWDGKEDRVSSCWGLDPRGGLQLGCAGDQCFGGKSGMNFLLTYSSSNAYLVENFLLCSWRIFRFDQSTKLAKVGVVQFGGDFGPWLPSKTSAGRTVRFHIGDLHIL